MKNISKVKDCFGCGVCAVVCKRGIIDISLNKEGFYQPYIKNENKCTECGLCIEVCAFHHDKLASENNPLISYAAWSKNIETRKECSSGGVSFEIASYLLEKGYKACGVKYCPIQKRAEHYIANNSQEFKLSIGSKYIQSYTIDAFNALNRKDKYLIIGTPCQIDSFRRYIQRFKIEENFILMDFFCHGVPSMLLWKKYLNETEQIIGNTADVSWRNKSNGWHDSWVMTITGERKNRILNKINTHKCITEGEKIKFISRLSQNDTFYYFFLNNTCLNKACYNSCKYKYNHSSADIRIGDLWGESFKLNEEGVSAVIIYTQRGYDAFQPSNCEFISLPFEQVAAGQMKKNPKEKWVRNWIIKSLDSNISLQTMQTIHKLYCYPKKVVNKIIRIIH